MSGYDTVCKECVFSKNEGKTQVGCEFNMIEAFRNAGVEVQESYDDEKEFYVIKDRVCHFGRTEKWADIQPSKEIAALKESVFSETAIKYQWILLDQGMGELEQVKLRLDEAMDQMIKPLAIHVLRYPGSKISLSDYGVALNKTKVIWSIQDVGDESLCQDHYINLVLNQFATPFIFKWNISSKIPATISSEVNNDVNIKVEKFGILDYGIGNVINANFFKFLKAGIFNKSLMDLATKEHSSLILYRDI